MSQSIESIVHEMLNPFLEKDGFEIVDIQYTKEGSQWFLRVFVDKAGGIDLDDCTMISEYLSQKLDEHDPIPNAYFLEVSSPGAERPLKKPKDFYNAVGQHVFVTTYEPVHGLKEFEGTLVSYDEQTMVIDLKKKSMEIPVAKVASARLAVLL